MDVPVAVFSFRRPEKLRGVLEALRAQAHRVPIVYHFCDGPRDAQDHAACDANRAVAREYGAYLKSEYTLRETNLGLFRNLTTGIDAVLSRHEAVIVLEDDVVPSPDCLPFLTGCLDSFRARADVFGISAYHPLNPDTLPPSAANGFLSPRFLCWGWATWADRWRLIRNDVLARTPPYAHYWNIPAWAGTDLRWALRDHRLGKRPITWAQLVALFCLHRNWLQVCPPHSLIENTGFDGSGENCPAAPTSTRTASQPAPLVLPPATLAPDEDLGRRVASAYLLPAPPLPKRLARLATYLLRRSLKRG